MSVVLDIARTYRAPREVIRRRCSGAPQESRALVTLMLACVIFFVAQWPYLARLAFEDPRIPLEARLGGALLGWVFMAPLVFYAIAALSHLVLRVFGGQASWYESRMALFWALLASSPIWLLNGLVGGFVGPGIAMTIVGTLAMIVFLTFWSLSLTEVEFGTGQAV